ncbi:MAG TPA: methylmalonyl-CoA mutase family protein, partial [Zeimonas sp.]
LMKEIIADVDAQGGIVKLIADGTIQSKVSEQAYRMQRDIESGAFPKVGVNCYRNEKEEDHPVEFHPYKDEDTRLQVESLNRVRAERDEAQVTRALGRVRADAQAGTNLMPAIVEAVKAYASVGEITREMVQVFGRYREPIRF